MATHVRIDRPSRAHYFDDVERITRKILQHSDPGTLAGTIHDITESLAQHGISFEGRALPVSLVPTVVPAVEIEALEHAGEVVRQVLNRVLVRFVEEHHARLFDGPLHRFFTPYYRWWDVIAAERRSQEHIQLMRYDAVRDDHGRWTFMETNTCCPGGTIHCARIRDAWRQTRLGRTLCQSELLSEFAIDSASGFVRFLAQQAAELAPAAPNIAILNYRGTYTNELESLRRCHAQLRDKGAVGAGELLLGDIRDVTCHGGRAYLDGKPLALIYNKLDQLQIDPGAAEVAGWVAAAAGEGTEFLNSLGAMYLTETKRVLALLSDPTWSHCLDLSEDEQAVIKEVIPFTRLVEDFLGSGAPDLSLPARERQAFVLKADALTRGSGVVIGDQVSREAWLEALEHTRTNHGVAQLKCHLPSRTGFKADPAGAITRVAEFYGVDVFYFGPQFAGLVSRSHTSQVFNVGAGGRESPVLIIERAHA